MKDKIYLSDIFEELNIPQPAPYEGSGMNSTFDGEEDVDCNGDNECDFCAGTGYGPVHHNFRRAGRTDAMLDGETHLIELVHCDRCFASSALGAKLKYSKHDGSAIMFIGKKGAAKLARQFLSDLMFGHPHAHKMASLMLSNRFDEDSLILDITEHSPGVVSTHPKIPEQTSQEWAQANPIKQDDPPGDEE